MKNKQIFILPAVLISLLTGILTGWLRIGWNLHIVLPSGEHGAIMTGSFIGTLICLERSISFPNRLALIVPLVNALSIIFFLAGMSKTAYFFLLLGSAGLTAIYFFIYVKHKNMYLLIMMTGALCYFIGNAILLRSSFYPASVMWWVAFLLFTITGERLELSRFIMSKNALKKQLVLIALLVLFTVGIVLPFHSAGGYMIGLSLIGTSLWLLKYDMARHSLKKPGVSFYSGLLLTTGYFWLMVTGIFMAYGSYFGLLYDASLHVFFLGFVFSMIFAHAPVILPAVLKIKIDPFGRSLYIWYFLLNFSLLLRVAGIFPIQMPPYYKETAGMLNGIAILGFFINMAVLAKIAKRRSVMI
ncbi:MAG: hypothetical protein K8I03_15025 [Ignavibacteria bacterium]|nr:hypothetical protein [Ignavibacteria bacterium]